MTLELNLAPYAMAEEESQGRRHEEDSHPYRSDYQRDRDRVIHSRAFRRLENKTQVFAPDHSDHFRNRLTHTLEVTQIARTIGRALSLNGDLCEVLSLSHDIGHPPFSHDGEQTLNAAMKRYGSGFEHNLHALVIVEDFEARYASFRGLNLTFEVREGIVKHSRDYDGSEVLPIDISEYRLDERPPLEAQIIDSADEIAYNAADLDDGYDSGLIDLDQMLRGSRLFEELFEKCSGLFPEAPEKLLVREALRRLIDRLVTSLVDETRRQIAENAIDSVEGVRSFPTRLVRLDPKTARQNREIKQFLRRNLYDHPTLKIARREARRLIRELLEYYLADPKRLPDDHFSLPVRDEPHRAVCNYVAGMTDNYARLMHRKIKEIPSGSN